MSLCRKTHIITISNIKDSETISYPLLFLHGEIDNYSCRYSEISIFNKNNDQTTTFSVSIINGKFKCLLFLVNGENCLSLKYCNAIKVITIVLCPSENIDRNVKLLYIICKDHDGCFQSPTAENTAAIACKRITVGVQLIQSLFAEKLSEKHFGRKTFKLNTECVPFYSQLSLDQAKQMSENQLWNYFAREILSSDFENCPVLKFVAFIGCTEYTGVTDGDFTHSNVKSKTYANAALGGGDLAIFGTGCLYTWPDNVDGLIEAFQNNTAVDRTKFLDDSNSRHTFGGCFATTLGSVCHEIGHIFDLGHTEHGIMGDGFDYVNRVFTIDNLTEDLPSRETNTKLETSKLIDTRLTSLNRSNTFLVKYQTQKDNDLTFLMESSAITLSHHKWFNHYDNSIVNKIGFDLDTRMVHSDLLPIRLIEFREKQSAMMKFYYQFVDKNVLKFKISKHISLELLNIFVMDHEGNIARFSHFNE